MLNVNAILQGDALTQLRRLPDESVDCVLTSPPYWGLRDYGASVATVWGGDEDCAHEWQPPCDAHGAWCAVCGAWKGQLGLEPAMELFLEHLSAVFDEVRRVLTPGGSCWVNLGDKYAGATRDGLEAAVAEKSLCLAPFRFAIAMVERGWLLRRRRQAMRRIHRLRLQRRVAAGASSRSLLRGGDHRPRGAQTQPPLPRHRTQSRIHPNRQKAPRSAAPHEPGRDGARRRRCHRGRIPEGGVTGTRTTTNQSKPFMNPMQTNWHFDDGNGPQESKPAVSERVSDPQPKPPTGPPRLAYNLREAAQMLGVSEKTIRRLVDRGLLKPSRGIRHLLFTKQALEKYLEHTTL